MNQFEHTTTFTDRFRTPRKLTGSTDRKLSDPRHGQQTTTVKQSDAFANRRQWFGISVSKHALCRYD